MLAHRLRRWANIKSTWGSRACRAVPNPPKSDRSSQGNCTFARSVCIIHWKARKRHLYCEIHFSLPHLAGEDPGEQIPSWFFSTMFSFSIPPGQAILSLLLRLVDYLLLNSSTTWFTGTPGRWATRGVNHSTCSADYPSRHETLNQFWFNVSIRNINKTSDRKSQLRLGERNSISMKLNSLDLQCFHRAS